MAEIKDWDILAANNSDAPPDGWPEGMNYSDVNNVGREGMAVLARFYKDTNGSILSTGAGNTYTLAINRTISTLADGDGFRFRADKANTGSITIDIGTASAEGVRPDGSSFVAGEIVANGIYDVAYSTTLSKFVVLGSEIVATQTSKGVVEFATNAEHLAGTSTALAAHPAGIKNLFTNDQSLTQKGHQVFPGGFIVNFDRSADLGDLASGSNSITFTFNKAFTNLLHVIPYVATDSGTHINVTAVWDINASSATQAVIRYAELGAQVQGSTYIGYIAIGN